MGPFISEKDAFRFNNSFPITDEQAEEIRRRYRLVTDVIVGAGVQQVTEDPEVWRSPVHQVRDWFSGAAAYFGWMREAKKENTRCGLRPMSDKAASQKTRSPEGCDENWPATALLLSHVSIQICSFVAPCRRPILIATPLNQSRTWCTRCSCSLRDTSRVFVLRFGKRVNPESDLRLLQPTRVAKSKKAQIKILFL